MAFQGLSALPSLKVDYGLLDASKGINAYRQGVEDRVAQDHRDLMKNVGATAASGNYLDAARTAMAGGDVKTGMDISNWDTGRRLKAVDFLTAGAQRADTPEKWNALVNVAENAFGPDLVKNYRDFNSRPQAITSLEQAKLKLAQAKDEREAREFEATMPLLAARTKAYEAAANQKGREQFKIVGPDLVGIDPTTGEARTVYRGAPKAKAMSVNDIGKLAEEGTKFSNLGDFATDFKDSYAGYTPGTGDLAMSAARVGIGTQNSEEAASWWQKYDRYKNEVRHELFGGALTPNETAQFEKADINPSMSPSQVRKNLALQSDIIEKGITRKASALIAGGYDPEVVSEAYGINLRDLGVNEEGRRSGPVPQPGESSNEQSTSGPKMLSPEEAQKLPPGTPFIGLDGKARIRQ